MSKFKKSLALLLSLAMIIGMIPLFVFSASAKVVSSDSNDSTKGVDIHGQETDIENSDQMGFSESNPWIIDDVNELYLLSEITETSWSTSMDAIYKQELLMIVEKALENLDTVYALIEEQCQSEEETVISAKTDVLAKISEAKEKAKQYYMDTRLSDTLTSASNNAGNAIKCLNGALTSSSSYYGYCTDSTYLGKLATVENAMNIFSFDQYCISYSNSGGRGAVTPAEPHFPDFDISENELLNKTFEVVNQLVNDGFNGNQIDYERLTSEVYQYDSLKASVLTLYNSLVDSVTNVVNGPEICYNNADDAAKATITCLVKKGIGYDISSNSDAVKDYIVNQIQQSIAGKYTAVLRIDPNTIDVPTLDELSVTRYEEIATKLPYLLQWINETKNAMDLLISKNSLEGFIASLSSWLGELDNDSLQILAKTLKVAWKKEALTDEEFISSLLSGAYQDEWKALVYSSFYSYLENLQALSSDLVSQSEALTQLQAMLLIEQELGVADMSLFCGSNDIADTEGLYVKLSNDFKNMSKAETQQTIATNSMSEIAADEFWDTCGPVQFEIGNEIRLFMGHFDGNNKVIYVDLDKNDDSCVLDDDTVGLFGGLGKGASIKNLTVDGYINGENTVGAIVGLNDHGTVDNCVNKAFVTGSGIYYYMSDSDGVGGIVGYNKNGVVTNSHNSGIVTASYKKPNDKGLNEGDPFIGGVVGYQAGVMSNCYNEGDITAEVVYLDEDGVTQFDQEEFINIGGLSGVTDWSKAYTADCYNTGRITTKSSVTKIGGLFGSIWNTNSTPYVFNCYNTGAVVVEDTCAKAYVGGLIGDVRIGATLVNCYNMGEVTVASEVDAIVGGVIGRYSYTDEDDILESESSRIYNCYYNNETCSAELAIGNFTTSSFKDWMIDNYIMGLSDDICKSKLDDSFYKVSGQKTTTADDTNNTENTENDVAYANAKESLVGYLTDGTEQIQNEYQEELISWLDGLKGDRDQGAMVNFFKSNDFSFNMWINGEDSYPKFGTQILLDAINLEAKATLPNEEKLKAYAANINTLSDNKSSAPSVYGNISDNIKSYDGELVNITGADWKVENSPVTSLSCGQQSSLYLTLKSSDSSSLNLDENTNICLPVVSTTVSMPKVKITYRNDEYTEEVTNYTIQQVDMYYAKNIIKGEDGKITVEFNLKACGHKFTPHASKDSNCTTEGYHGYYFCEKCGDFYADGYIKDNIAVLDDNIVISLYGDDVDASIQAYIDAERLTPKSIEILTNYARHDINSADEMIQNIKEGKDVYVNGTDVFDKLLKVTKEDLLIAKKAHKTTFMNGKKATCVSPDKTDCYYCEVCHQLFEDKDCTKSINMEEVIGNVDKTNHTQLELVNANEATCSTTGTKSYYHCKGCNRCYFDKDCTKEIEAQDAGNSHMTPAFTSDYYRERYINTFTGIGEDGNAQYEKTPYLTAQIKINFPVFYNSIKTDVDLTNHTALKYNKATTATCSKEGTKAYYHCADCNRFYEGRNGKTGVNQIETYNSDGDALEVTKCETEELGTLLFRAEKSIDDPSKASDLGIVENLYDSSFEDEIRIYSNCEFPTKAWEEEIFNNALKETNPDLIWVVNDTSSSLYLKTSTYKASCDFELLESAISTGKDTSNHTGMEYVSATEATCTTTGNREYFKCSGCNKVYSDKAGKYELDEQQLATAKNPNNHPNWTTPVSNNDATCTHNGTKTSYCTACNAEKVEEDKGTQKQHSWDEGHVIQEPTTTTTGTIEYICTVCGASKKNSDIPKLNTLSSAILAKKSYVYDGTVKTPDVVVKSNGVTLTKNTDYTVKYQNNKLAGKAKVTITGVGQYRGVITKTFTIVPKATKMKSAKVKGKNVKIQWAKKLSQAQGYRLQYSTNKNFKLAKEVTKVQTIKNETITSFETGKLKKGKYYLRVKTYKEVNGVRYYSGWSNVKTVTVK